jgi:Thioredoxin
MTLVAEHIVDDATPHNYTDEEYEHATRVALPVMIAKVDCVTNQAFCAKNFINAYPTLRLFVDGT